MATCVEPLVSIILTTLNGARYLRESMDSCLGQTYRNIELIVVDGGSTDGTLDVLAAYRDQRLQLVHQTGNVGRLPGALNIGLSVGRGEYLTWMQDDCIYDPCAIEVMVSTLQAHPEVGQVYADFWEIDASGTIIGKQVPLQPEQFLSAKGDPAGVCFLIRRSVRDVVGPHDVDTFPVQDADYRWRIARQFQSLHIHEPLYYWRLHPHSLTGSRPWVVDARLGVPVRLKLGLITRAQAREDLAEFDIAFAFDRFQHGDTGPVPRLVSSGLLRNPRYVANRGIWSILVRSLLCNMRHSAV